MTSRLFGTPIFGGVLLFVMPCYSQDKAKVPTPPDDKSVEWFDIRVPRFPPLAHQARRFGTVAIEVRFKGCELDPSSPRIVSGPPMLTPAAMESLKQSVFRCGDFADSNATVYYEFGEYPTAEPSVHWHWTCDSQNPRLEVAGSHIRVFVPGMCVQP